MIFLTADTLMFIFFNILCCKLTALVSIWIKIFDFINQSACVCKYGEKSISLYMFSIMQQVKLPIFLPVVMGDLLYNVNVVFSTLLLIWKSFLEYD